MKINLETFRKNKREIYFSLVGSLLTLILIYVFVTSISFLVSSVEAALSVESGNQNVVHFNLGALDTLGITQNSPSSSGASSGTSTGTSTQ